ncbi:MAG TPA: pyruvate kinase [Solirubrobacterales bacterium]|nr:pyruvate kinase [Solirubrobacterales bacterium]
MESHASAGSGAHLERRTKIIATVGPASWAPEVLEQLIAAGADVFRLNFSHAGRERQAETIAAVRTAAERVGREVAILGDLPGPKLRIGSMRDDVAELETGMHVTLTPEEVEGDRDTIPVQWSGVSDLREDQLVYLADGAIRLRVSDAEDGGVGAEVEVGGTLSSHKGMNIPGGVDLPATTGVDLGWVEFAVENGVDLLAVSFVSNAADLDLGADTGVLGRAHTQPDRAVGEVDDLVLAQVGDARPGDRDRLLIPLDVLRRQRHVHPRLQLGEVIAQRADPQLRPRQVAKDRHLLADPLRRRPDRPDRLRLPLRRGVGEVQPEDIGPRSHQLLQHRRLPTGRANRGDDLGPALAVGAGSGDPISHRRRL